MNSNDNVMPLDQQSIEQSDQAPKKKWETPTFEQYSVANTTLGKSNNSNETNMTVGPLS